MHRVVPLVVHPLVGAPLVRRVVVLQAHHTHSYDGALFAVGHQRVLRNHSYVVVQLVVEHWVLPAPIPQLDPTKTYKSN